MKDSFAAVFLLYPEDYDDDQVGWEGDPALMRFAHANEDGDTYALWRLDDRADLATLPVVVVGKERDFYVVARHVREFLQLLGALDGIEVRVKANAIGLRNDGEPCPARAEYLAWLDEHLGLSPAKDAAAVIRAAQEAVGI